MEEQLYFELPEEMCDDEPGELILFLIFWLRHSSQSLLQPVFSLLVLAAACFYRLGPSQGMCC